MARATGVWNPASPKDDSVSREEVRALERSLCNLAPGVRPEEANLAARCAIEYSRQLAAEYRVVRPPLFHNFMVNARLKKRGLCFHWTEDLLAQFQALNLVSLEAHWGIARAGTLREHNSVVLTARGEPFDRGLVLDAWRRSGRLTWARVREDTYPWEEGEREPAP